MIESTAISHYLILSALLFSIGAAGVMVRRNLIVVFMCLELMFNAANIAFVALSKHVGNLNGQLSALLVMVVATAETAIGLAIVIAMYRNAKSIESSEAVDLMG